MQSRAQPLPRSAFQNTVRLANGFTILFGIGHYNRTGSGFDLKRQEVGDFYPSPDGNLIAQEVHQRLDDVCRNLIRQSGTLTEESNQSLPIEGWALLTFFHGTGAP